MTPRITIKNIAQRAGTSVTTVSFVLNGKAELHHVSPATVERVLEVARQADYLPNYHAQTFSRQRSDSLGVIFRTDAPSHNRSGFWQGILGGVAEYARARGSDLVLVSGQSDEEVIERALMFHQQRRVDALVLPNYADRILNTRSVPAGLRAVLIGEARGRGAWPRVQLDEEPGLRQAVEHLAALGHRELLWIGPVSPGDTRNSRSARFKRAAEDAGMACRIVGRPPLDDDKPPHPVEVFTALWHAFAAPVLAADRCATAVVCYNDHIALGVQAALNDLGRRVPHDVSLLGFDDIYARLAVPPLTVVSQRLHEVGVEACRLALRMVDDPSEVDRLASTVQWVPSELIVNASTGVPRAPSARPHRPRKVAKSGVGLVGR